MGILLKVPVISILCISIVSVCASLSIESNHCSLGSPLALFNTPSLIANRNNLSFASTIGFAGSDFTTKVASTVQFDNNFFSAGFQRLINNNLVFSRISTAFSHSEKHYILGAAFHYPYYENTARLTCDASGGLVIQKSKFLLISFNNIFNFDSSFVLLPFTISSIFTGEIKKLEDLNFDVSVSALSTDEPYNLENYQISLGLNKDFLLNPKITLSGSGVYLYGPQVKNPYGYSFGVGVYTTIASYGAGIFFGVESENDRLIQKAGIFFNPRTQEINTQTVSLTLATEYLDPSDTTTDFEVLISIDPGQSRQPNIKNWTVAISKSEIEKQVLIKSYSGGGIPPSTIIWDCRDYRGKLQTSGEFKIRIVAVDMKGKILQSPWQKLTIK